MDPRATHAEAEPMGIDEPRVRRVLRRRRLGAVAAIVLSLVFLVGAGGGISAIDDALRSRQDGLERHPGHVVAVADDEGDRDEHIVTVRFGPDHDHLREVAIEGVEGDYSADQAVTVLVDRDDPGTVTLPGENYVPGWATTLFGVVALMAFGLVPSSTWYGAVELIRVRQIRRVLQRHPLRPVDARFLANRGDRGEPWTEVRPHRVELPTLAPGMTFTWRPTSPTTWLDESVRAYRVDAAGDGRNVVFRPPGRTALELARLPKLRQPSSR